MEARKCLSFIKGVRGGGWSEVAVHGRTWSRGILIAPTFNGDNKSFQSCSRAVSESVSNLIVACQASSLSVFLSLSLPFRLSVSLSHLFCLSSSVSDPPPFCVSALPLFVSFSLSLPIYLFIYLPICLSIYLSIYLSLYLSFPLC